METTEKTIDIEKVLKGKMGSKARWVPKPLVWWLKHIVHEDTINDHLYQSRHLQGTPWLKATLDYLKVRIQVKGLENLPAKDDPKRYTFVSNHPLGGIDGVAIGSVIGEHYDDNFRYLVNDLLMNLPGLAPLCIPINKTGKNGRDFPAMVEAGFQSDTHILMFPAGLCSRKHNGMIRDLEWKKTFITKSVETHRDVIPIYFDGRNSDFFYRLSNISDRYVKKINIAMLFLADEMFKNVGHTFTITFGKPIPWETFTKEKNAMEWAKIVKNEVYKLSQNE